MREDEVIEAGRLRRAARGVFDTQRALVRADLDAAGVGKRAAMRLAEDGRMIAEEAADAARDNRPLVAAGVLGITAWLLRKPLMAFAGRLARDETDDADETGLGEDTEEDFMDSSSPNGTKAGTAAR